MSRSDQTSVDMCRVRVVCVPCVVYLIRSDDIAQALGHLVPVHGPVGMGHDPLRQGQLGGHQERNPVDGVEADNVFPDDVVVGRPRAGGGNRHRRGGLAVPRETSCGEIVGERVEPDVDGVPVIAWHRDAPLDSASNSRDGQVLQLSFLCAASCKVEGTDTQQNESHGAYPQKAKELVGPDARNDGAALVRVFQPSKQWLLEGRQLELVVLFYHPLHHVPALERDLARIPLLVHS